MRVALVAHHANPDWGSEPLISWNWIRHLAEVCELHVVTHIRNQDALLRRGLSNVQWHFVDTERLARRIQNWNDRIWGEGATTSRLVLDVVALSAFDRQAVRILKNLHAEKPLDVIHRVSPITPRSPTNLWSIGVPVILGPVNGGMTLPAGFRHVAREERLGILGMRGGARLLDPLARGMRRSERILVANRTTLSTVPRDRRGGAEVLCENAVDPELFRFQMPEREGRLNVAYVGRLVPFKGARLVLEAVARARQHIARFDIVGDGVERARLEAMIDDLDLRGTVRMWGKVAVEEVPEFLAEADVFAFPSVRESGGAVILEAMASGTVPIVVDHGGPAETVVDGTGILLDATTPDQVVDELTTSMIELATDRERLRRMARAGRDHVLANHTWPRRIERALELYREVSEPRRMRA